MKIETGLKRDFFLQIQNRTLCNILKSFELRGNELDLYKAVYKWAEKFCEKNNQITTSENIRLALGEAFNLIRFGAMTAIEFSKCIDDNSILHSKEMVKIFKLIAVGESECDFSNVKRTGFGIKELKFKLPLDNIYIDSNCYVDITTNKHVFLHGIFLSILSALPSISFKKTWGGMEYSLNLTILLESPDKNNKTFKSINLLENQVDDTVCLFKKAVYCKANIKYRIWFLGFSLTKYGYADLADKEFNSNDVVFSINSPCKTPFAGLIFE